MFPDLDLLHFFHFRTHLSPIDFDNLSLEVDHGFPHFLLFHDYRGDFLQLLFLDKPLFFDHLCHILNNLSFHHFLPQDHSFNHLFDRLKHLLPFPDHLHLPPCLSPGPFLVPNMYVAVLMPMLHGFFYLTVRTSAQRAAGFFGDFGPIIVCQVGAATVAPSGFAAFATLAFYGFRGLFRF